MRSPPSGVFISSNLFVIAGVQLVGGDRPARPSKPHSGLSAIREFNAGGLKGAANGGSRLD